MTVRVILGFVMGFPFGHLFLIILLFADLTDDVIALVQPTMPVGLPLAASEQSVLISFRYRAQAESVIRQTHYVWARESSIDLFASFTWVEWVLEATAWQELLHANSLYVLMSLQR